MSVRRSGRGRKAAWRYGRSIRVVARNIAPFAAVPSRLRHLSRHLPYTCDMALVHPENSGFLRARSQRMLISRSRSLRAGARLEQGWRGPRGRRAVAVDVSNRDHPDLWCDIGAAYRSLPWNPRCQPPSTEDDRVRGWRSRQRVWSPAMALTPNSRCLPHRATVRLVCCQECSRSRFATNPFDVPLRHLQGGPVPIPKIRDRHRPATHVCWSRGHSRAAPMLGQTRGGVGHTAAARYGF